MGKGDRRTRRGKIFKGTYGKSRPRKKRNKKITPYSVSQKLAKASAEQA
jgi:30S ribosomal protein S31